MGFFIILYFVVLVASLLHVANLVDQGYARHEVLVSSVASVFWPICLPVALVAYLAERTYTVVQFLRTKAPKNAPPVEG